MIIGIPREVKDKEYRVGMTPAGAAALVDAGHEVLVETGAGVGSGFADGEYAAAGATLEGDKERLFAAARMIVKVKEPVAEEYYLLRPGLILFTYLHLASSRELTEAVVGSGVDGVAYETIETPDGKLPLLAPMSEVAGKLAVQVGAALLRKDLGGSGVLLPGPTAAGSPSSAAGWSGPTRPR
jgi:alanine dehydrogenase